MAEVFEGVVAIADSDLPLSALGNPGLGPV